MQISYQEFQALLDRISKLEKRMTAAEKGLADNEKEFEIVCQAKEDMDDRLVNVENKLFPKLSSALRNASNFLGKTDSRPYNSLDFPDRKPGGKKKD